MRICSSPALLAIYAGVRQHNCFATQNIRTHYAWVSIFWGESPLKFCNYQTGIKKYIIPNAHDRNPSVCNAQRQELRTWRFVCHFYDYLVNEDQERLHLGGHSL